MCGLLQSRTSRNVFYISRAKSKVSSFNYLYIFFQTLFFFLPLFIFNGLCCTRKLCSFTVPRVYSTIVYPVFLFAIQFVIIIFARMCTRVTYCNIIIVPTNTRSRIQKVHFFRRSSPKCVVCIPIINYYHNRFYLPRRRILRSYIAYNIPTLTCICFVVVMPNNITSPSRWIPDAPGRYDPYAKRLNSDRNF